MTRRFVKMHGAGNDFVILDARDQPLRPDAALVRRIADRRRGVGCDQLLVIESIGGRLGYRIYNGDGSPAEQCGNGARCVARYLLDRGALATGDELLAPSGPVCVRVDADQVSLTLGVPRFEAREVPFTGDPTGATIEAAGGAWPFEVVSMGNPHAVVPVEDAWKAPVDAVAAALQADARFPAGVNVGFCAVEAPDRIHLRVVERGAGETPACGSAACAAVALGRRAGRLAAAVSVVLPGGLLRVAWPGEHEPVWLGGPAVQSFSGLLAEELLHE